MTELEKTEANLRDQLELVLKSNTELETSLKQEIESFKSENDDIKSEKDNEIKILTVKLQSTEEDYKIVISEKEELKTKIEELEQLIEKEREDHMNVLNEKNSEVQVRLTGDWFCVIIK